jgi:DNA-binding NarL/FixJ family response regulator
MALGSTLAIDSQRARQSFRPRGTQQHARFSRMTPRMLQVKELMAQGATVKQIAAQLGLGVGTAKTYCFEVRRLTGMSRRELERTERVAEVHAAEGMPRMGAFE